MIPVWHLMVSISNQCLPGSQCFRCTEFHHWCCCHLPPRCSQLRKYCVFSGTYFLLGLFRTMYLYNTLNSNLAYSNRVAQSAPKSKNLPGHQSYLCLLPNCWEKCIETPKKLMPRVCKKLPHLGPHLPYGFQWKMPYFGRGHFRPL